MGKSVKELFQSMNLYEFQMWLQYYNENPFGEYRKDLQSALMTKNLLAPWSKSELSLSSLLLIQEEEKELESEDLARKIKGFLGVL